MICAGTGCVANGSLKVKDALETELIKRNLQNEIKIVLTGCNGFCAKGPVMVVYPEDIFYQLVKPEDVPHLVEEHFIKGRPVQKFLYTPPTEKKTIPVMNEIPFFKHQVLRALRNRSLIDAEKIEEYIARDGYMAAAKALTEMTPEQIVAEVKKSGLRGRGRRGVPDRPQVGALRACSRAISNTSCATATRATRARSWTGASWRRTPTRCSKA